MALHRSLFLGYPWFGYVSLHTVIFPFLSSYLLLTGGTVSVMTNIQYHIPIWDPPQLQHLHRDHFGDYFPRYVLGSSRGMQ